MLVEEPEHAFATRLQSLRDDLADAVEASDGSALWLSLPLRHSFDELADAIARNGELSLESVRTLIGRAEAALHTWNLWCADNGIDAKKKSGRILRSI